MMLLYDALAMRETQRLEAAASYNSSLASSHSEADRLLTLHLDPFVVRDLGADRRDSSITNGEHESVPTVLHYQGEKLGKQRSLVRSEQSRRRYIDRPLLSMGAAPAVECG